MMRLCSPAALPHNAFPEISMIIRNLTFVVLGLLGSLQEASAGECMLSHAT
jgi:hypothetical protein